jgi:hypothetical protein
MKSTEMKKFASVIRKLCSGIRSIGRIRDRNLRRGQQISSRKCMALFLEA